MLGQICLVKIKNNKVFPALIVDIRENENIVVSQLKPLSNKSEKNVVYIGHPKGLKNESVAMIYRLFYISEKDIIKNLSKIEKIKAQEVLDEYERYIRIRSLHKELHNLKKKITLAQFNNTDYRGLEKRLSEVLEEIGYEDIISKSRYKVFNGFRVAPTEGYTKVYGGGR
ncbi:hypothetical protein [Clostridium formicaceticum]|uniref:Uncharacterized protein n=1 Tax=Clostridium formicaceticum TaxID=1497 RepID=A0AAC9RNX7_9CLOT|nr:hypothetical protein [Clostridium formicaceticum]AOY74694.1 hypothetical protein BJL90_01230 [Clostridium formicaceticum]ARE89072.1 hypothetical protein CLFO_34780 [Clostridium formicaceticum]